MEVDHRLARDHAADNMGHHSDIYLGEVSGYWRGSYAALDGGCYHVLAGPPGGDLSMLDDKVPVMVESIKEAAEARRKSKCKICGCLIHREKDTYARPSVQGRSHATRHHHIPERFFGRSKNRPGTKRQGIFDTSPWGFERQTEVFCYECHEELLHNPVLLPDDIEKFAALARSRHLDEPAKTSDRTPIAGRIILLHDVIARGLDSLLAEEGARVGV